MFAAALMHAPPIVQVYCLIGIGAVLALTTMVQKWLWRGVGHFLHQVFRPRGREHPALWRTPEQVVSPDPARVREPDAP